MCSVLWEMTKKCEEIPTIIAEKQKIAKPANVFDKGDFEIMKIENNSADMNDLINMFFGKGFGK